MLGEILEGFYGTCLRKNAESITEGIPQVAFRGLPGRIHENVSEEILRGFLKKSLFLKKRKENSEKVFKEITEMIIEITPEIYGRILK